MPAAITRITIEPGKRGGKPCIRGLRITVWAVLGWLGAGMTEEQILNEHPDLEKADFPAVYQFVARPAVRRISADPAPGRKPFATPGTAAGILVRRIDSCA